MSTDEVLSAFEPRFSMCGDLVVAGGSVRDELMGRTPKDYDLFCLWSGDWKFEDARDTLTERLDGLELVPVDEEIHASEPFLVAGVRFNGAIVQVMASPERSAGQLLDTFDWNVCLFARTRHGLIQRTPVEDIGKGKELKLNRVTFPLSTMRRGFRFSERFGMKMRKEDITLLCERVIEMESKIK